MEGRPEAGGIGARGPGAGRTRRALPLVLTAFLAAAGASEASAQMFRTVFNVGAPGDPGGAPVLGTIASLEVHPEDGRVRVVDDSSRVHVFDAAGRRVEGGGDPGGWSRAPGSGDVPGLPEGATVVGPGTAVFPTGDSTGVGVAWLSGGEVTGERTFALPAEGRIARVLADGTGRAWLLVCPADGCGEQERWIVLEPPPASAPDEPPGFSAVAFPARFRLHVVRGDRFYGVQGAPGRQSLHVIQLYEQGGGAP